MENTKDTYTIQAMVFKYKEKSNTLTQESFKLRKEFQNFAEENFSLLTKEKEVKIEFMKAAKHYKEIDSITEEAVSQLYDKMSADNFDLLTTLIVESSSYEELYKQAVELWLCSNTQKLFETVLEGVGDRAINYEATGKEYEELQDVAIKVFDKFYGQFGDFLTKIKQALPK